MNRESLTEEALRVVPAATGKATDTTDAEKVKESLRQSVRQFQVCYEVLPDNYVVHKTLRQIGFRLDLVGTHAEGVEHPQPGCEHCRRVWLALNAIAEWILPREKRDSVYDIVPYDQGIHFDPVRQFRPEVSLKILICHRSGFDREVDACEVRCLREMTQRLEELGVRRGKW